MDSSDAKTTNSILELHPFDFSLHNQSSLSSFELALATFNINATPQDKHKAKLLWLARRTASLEKRGVNNNVRDFSRNNKQFLSFFFINIYLQYTYSNPIEYIRMELLLKLKKIFTSVILNSISISKI